MGKRSGFARRPHDDYETPAAAIVQLLPHLDGISTFAEPCAGRGALILALEAHGLRCVRASELRTDVIDLLAEGIGFGIDALAADPDIYDAADAIITNPPWTRKLLHPLIERLSRIKPTWLLLDADWAHTRQAAELIRRCRKIVSAGRVKWIESSASTGKDNAAWYLFDVSHEVGPVFVGSSGRFSSDVPVLNAVPAALEALGRLELQVRSAATFDALDELANAAAGLQRRFRPIKDVADRAGEVWIAAEVRVGEELEKQPKAKGGEQHHKGTRSKLEPVPTLAELGVARKRAARARRLAALPFEDRKAFTEELKAEEKALTPDALLRKQREHTRRDKKHTQTAAVFSADGPFDCVVIDPPWPMAKIDRDVRPNQDAFDYATMTEVEIAAFWKREMASRVKTDCHLFMWTTEKFLPTAIGLLDQIGFRYVLTMVWHKPGGFQPIDLPQYNCEFIVYARRGSPLFIDTTNFFCCFTAARREHSRKPDLFYDTVRRVTGGSRIDVFSRELRDGFAQYGNETGRFAREAA